MTEVLQSLTTLTILTNTTVHLDCGFFIIWSALGYANR